MHLPLVPCRSTAHHLRLVYAVADSCGEQVVPHHVYLGSCACGAFFSLGIKCRYVSSQFTPPTYPPPPCPRKNTLLWRVQALLEAGANVDIKSGTRYHLMDEAVLTGDQAIVRQVYMRAQQQTWLRWQERLPHLLDILEKIPVSVFCNLVWHS